MRFFKTVCLSTQHFKVLRVSNEARRNLGSKERPLASNEEKDSGMVVVQVGLIDYLRTL